MRFTDYLLFSASGNPYTNVGGIAHGYGSEDFFRVYVSPGTAMLTGTLLLEVIIITVLLIMRI